MNPISRLNVLIASIFAVAFPKITVERGKYVGLELNPGFEWNPLLKYPPNKLCFCGKDQKYKACCLPTMRKAVTHEQAKVLKRYMSDIADNDLNRKAR